MIVRQIRSKDGTGTLSYLIADVKVAAIIDPNIEDTQEIRLLASEIGVRVTHVIDTHTHADHISAADELKKVFDAQVCMHENTKNKWKIVDEGDKFGIGDVLRANARIPIDRYLKDGDTVEVRDTVFSILFTPGHTDNHVALMADDCLFTGDLLLIGQAGRSDLPGGDPGEQYESLFTRIIPLPDTVKMFPGHDYAGNEFAYLGDEKKNNPFLQLRTKSEYIEFVREFFPPLAEAIASGSKMTLQCGTTRVARAADGLSSIKPADLAMMLKSDPRPFLLDVREPVELLMSGAIDGVKNIPVGQLAARLSELPPDRSTTIVSICASGARSFEAAHYLIRQGYQNVVNLEGGTTGWIKSGLGVVKPRQPA